MIPLRVDAYLYGPISLGVMGYLHLDAILAAAVCLRDNIPPATTPDEVQPIEIPVQRSACGCFHLASASIGGYEQMQRRHIVRRFPLAEAQALCDKASVSTQSGPHRDFRFPLEAGHLVQDRLSWWCLAEMEAVADLLALIRYLGKKRAVGLGKVQRWTVEACEPWGDGFPIVSPEGHVLRHLPADYPGAIGSPTYGRLTYPYHHLGAPEQLVLAPCR